MPARQVAQEAGALVCVDNSILTCMYQPVLDLGADIAMTSGAAGLRRPPLLHAAVPCPATLLCAGSTSMSSSLVLP